MVQLVLFSDFFVHEHIFFFFLKSGFLGTDLVSQLLSFLNWHAILLGSAKFCLDIGDLLVTLLEIYVVSFSLSASSLQFFLICSFLSSLLSLCQCCTFDCFRFSKCSLFGFLRSFLKNFRLSFHISLIHILLHLSILQQTDVAWFSLELWTLIIISK